MCSAPHRKPYPSDVSDEECSLSVPYRTLMTAAAPQHDRSVRDLFNTLRYVIRYDIAWRAMPNDFPPWAAVHQQSQCWLVAGCFEVLAQDLRALLRLASGRAEKPTATIIDRRTLRSTSESGTRPGYDEARCKRGSRRPGGCHGDPRGTAGQEENLAVACDVGEPSAVAACATAVLERFGRCDGLLAQPGRTTSLQR